jgi:two-component system sensor histidine kinase KdpD
MLIVDRGREELLEVVTKSLVENFGFATAAVVIPGGVGVNVIACSGETLSAEELPRIVPSGGQLGGLVIDSAGRSAPLYVGTLLTNSDVVGLLVIRPSDAREQKREVVAALASAIALALSQLELRSRLLHSEMLEERDRWRRALVSSISHDLRTPLAGMKASISNLRDGSIELCESDRDELLETIESRTDHLTRLVTNILDMSRIEADALEPRLELTAVFDLITDSLLSFSSDDRSRRIHCEVPENLPLVRVDHALISQAISNLVENGLRYNVSGERVIIGAQAIGKVVRVSVRDFGPGVPPNRREEIFQMFEKDSTSGGAGLGLALSQSYLGLHGSEISVEDAPGGGAIFSFLLPQAEYLRDGED